jgi:hypothetical protein
MNVKYCIASMTVGLVVGLATTVGWMTMMNHHPSSDGSSSNMSSQDDLVHPNKDNHNLLAPFCAWTSSSTTTAATSTMSSRRPSSSSLSCEEDIRNTGTSGTTTKTMSSSSSSFSSRMICEEPAPGTGSCLKLHFETYPYLVLPAMIEVQIIDTILPSPTVMVIQVRGLTMTVLMVLPSCMVVVHTIKQQTNKHSLQYGTG